MGDLFQFTDEIPVAHTPEILVPRGPRGPQGALGPAPVLFRKIAEANQGWQQARPQTAISVGGASFPMSVSQPISTSYSASEILNRAR